MHAVSTNISAIYRSPVNIRETSEASFTTPFHFHPEYELVHIVAGSGKRIIGSTVQDFKAGELVLIGPNVSHVWMSDQRDHSPHGAAVSRAIVLNFDSSIFSETFYAMEETYSLKKLFGYSQGGISINGATKTHVVARLAQLLTAKNLDKVIYLLDILQALSISTELEAIEPSGLARQYNNCGRLTSLFQYITCNLEKTITLQQAADLTNFTPPSFARFFKQKTGKTFMDYVQETRVSCASKTLMETDLTVAQVAHGSGFKTVTNFNKWFKRVTGASPTEYRNSLSGQMK